VSAALERVSERALAVAGGSLPLDEKLAAICRLLHDEVPHYDWVGFYRVDPASPRALVLGPYVGASTDHTRIPFGRGICGRVAENPVTLVIQDVSEETNYLSCSIDVRSEIVVPILDGGSFVAQLDIDSHRLAPFTPADRALLESICEALAPFF